MEKPRSEVVSEGVSVLEKVLRDYSEGKLPGLVLSYRTEDGGSKHQLLGEFADDLMAAIDQVRRLDVALNRHFLRPDS